MVTVTAATSTTNVPNCTHYEVKLIIQPERVPSVFKLYGGTIAVDCTLTLENHTDRAISTIPLLLYRLLHVDQIDDGAGQALPFTQDVVALEEEPRWQVNAITVSLPAPLAAGASTRVRLGYHGPVCGYSEVMAYVQDHISERYTLLRWETLWFPLGGYPEEFFPRDTFQFDLSVTVPPGDLIVASNGRMSGVERDAEGVCYHWHSLGPIKWGRMTVACAPFKQLSVSPTVSLYYLMDENGNEQAVVRAVQRAHELGTAWFGPLSSQVLNIVEVPEGYGGEAADHLILIPAGTFKGDEQTVYRRSLSQLGHELIHLWNAPSREETISRFLDEAITHYVEALLLREEFGEDAYWEQMRRYRNYFLSAGEAAHPVPLAEAGLHGQLTEPVSRGKGPWALCVLHHLLGDRLLSALRTFFDCHRAEGATLEDFQATVTQIAGVDLEPFFQDWLWGTASSALLAQGMGEKALAATLAGRYGLNERNQSSGYARQDSGE
jgi:hypothetical protein